MRAMIARTRRMVYAIGAEVLGLAATLIGFVVGVLARLEGTSVAIAGEVAHHVTHPQLPDVRRASRIPGAVISGGMRLGRSRLPGRRPADYVPAARPLGPLTGSLGRAVRFVLFASPLGRRLGRMRLIERALPIAVALLVLVASTVTLDPARQVDSASTGNTNGAGTAPRLLAAGAGDASTNSTDPNTDEGSAEMIEGPGGGVSGISSLVADQPAVDAGPAATSGPSGPFGIDGTLFIPVVPDTTVEDGSALIKKYVVQKGDTIAGIARKFKLTQMSLVWSNDLTSLTLIHVGQKLLIPPETGVVIKVAATDTLKSLAAEYHVSADAIVSYNQLQDRTVTLGQMLVLPGGKGAPLPKPSTNNGGSSGGSGSTRYTGGAFRWPVPGGYMSQGYHYGHWAIDIAADYGTRIVAVAGGTVVFSGWKNNGGGYQVWINHGNGLYSTYAHMSGVSVGTGQGVRAGQTIGHVGATGHATGPHCHFEVWRGGLPWDGGNRRNPLAYL